MKRFLLPFILLIVLFSCKSVKKHNAQITKLHSVDDLHRDIDKLYQQQSKIQLASKYLKKAKRRITIGNIVSGVTFSTAFISFLIGIAPSTGFIDLSEIYFAAAGVLVLTGQAINIPLKISAKENIRMAKDLIREVDNINYNSQSLVH